MKRSFVVVAVVAVFITGLIWAGVHNRRERMLAAQKAESSHITLKPANGDQAGQAVDDGSGMEPVNLRGKGAPGFSLVSLDGQKVSLAQFKGHPVLVNFWATWCAPCKLEMPWFEEFRAKYAPQGLVILGVSMDDVGKDEIARTVKKTGVTYPILLKDEKIGNDYGGVDYLPMSFYVSKDGVVVEQSAGLGTKDQIEAHIRKLLGVSGQ